VFAEPGPGHADALRAFIAEEVTPTVEQPGAGLGICFASGRPALRPAAEELLSERMLSQLPS